MPHRCAVSTSGGIQQLGGRGLCDVLRFESSSARWHACGSCGIFTSRKNCTHVWSSAVISALIVDRRRTHLLHVPYGGVARRHLHLGHQCTGPAIRLLLHRVVAAVGEGLAAHQHLINFRRPPTRCSRSRLVRERCCKVILGKTRRTRVLPTQRWGPWREGVDRRFNGRNAATLRRPASHPQHARTRTSPVHLTRPENIGSTDDGAALGGAAGAAGAAGAGRGDQARGIPHVRGHGTRATTICEALVAGCCKL